MEIAANCCTAGQDNISTQKSKSKTEETQSGSAEQIENRVAEKVESSSEKKGLLYKEVEAEIRGCFHTCKINRRDAEENDRTDRKCKENESSKAKAAEALSQEATYSMQRHGPRFTPMP